MPESRDAVWQGMSSLVHNNRDSWRRAVIDRTGLPFSRIRILTRLGAGPMTVKQLAAAATVDAPAATVAVTDLELRGLVDRQTNPANRRTKIVSLTESGQEMLDLVAAIADPAPAAFGVLTDDELSTLAQLVAKMAERSPRRK
jgi:DNA-binding MarR family transcriptional regulator